MRGLEEQGEKGLTFLMKLGNAGDDGHLVGHFSEVLRQEKSRGLDHLPRPWPFELRGLRQVS